MNAIKKVNLEGSWDFTPENGEKQQIKVPGGGWLKQGFVCEAGTYETWIKIPDTGRPQVVKLELGAVNHIAEYYIGKDENSLEKIYEEVTAFTPQAVELTKHVEAGKTYLLRIFVRAYKDGRPVAPHWAEWCECLARGIFKDVYLRIYPEVYISDTFVKTYVSNNTFTYDVWVTNSSEVERKLTLGGDLLSWNGKQWIYPELPEVSVIVRAGETIKVAVGPLNWTVGQEGFWLPNIPYKEGYKTQLHLLRLFVKERENTLHTNNTRFGFRELKQAGKYFELNGVRINFVGDNLQVANYDRVDNGGKGDAMHTLPGFLPPSESNPGWPKAVDNFLRLNYNVQREHMGPWTPYMLDVCDELGLMLIGESACRWDGFDMDNGRGFHEVKCLQDIVKRDKNHPSIVRWSSKNESQCAEEDYHYELYEAIKAIDDTRPIFEDFITADWNALNPNVVFKRLLEKGDFTWMEHYMTYADDGKSFFSSILHNDAIRPLEDRPFGTGEADWMRSSTPAGLPWFATTIALVRATGASDVRPYTLLSSWASCIPGIKNTDLLTEENRHPVYGENNLSDPWSNPGIMLLQKACHPLFAFDLDFWKLNRKCDAFGHFPVKYPAYKAQEHLEREIIVFNDELEGDKLQVVWEIREGGPTNWILEKGSESLKITPGFMGKLKISFTAPIFNTFVFMTIKVYKGGELRFTDELNCYEIVEGEDFKSEFNGQERTFL